MNCQIWETKDFIDANFDGRDFLIDYSHGVDYIEYDPEYKSLQFSDIIGTIESTNFYIELCPEIDDDIFKKIRWIIDRQLSTGGWTIASKELFHDKSFLMHFPNPKYPSQENESILNTVNAVKVITNFLLKLFYVEKQTEKKAQ